MSYTMVYAITKVGPVRPFGKAPNALHGAEHVWAVIAHRLGLIQSDADFGRLMVGGEQALWPVWNATKNELLEPWERIVLAASLDNCVVLRGGLLRLADAMQTWRVEHHAPGSNLADQARLIRSVAGLRARYSSGTQTNAASRFSTIAFVSDGTQWNELFRTTALS